jgi:hypothetical protein
VYPLGFTGAESVLPLHQRLIGFRRRHPWLVHAQTAAERCSRRRVSLRPAFSLVKRTLRARQWS